MKILTQRLFWLVLLFGVATISLVPQTLQAIPLTSFTKASIPEVLKPWIPWVLRDTEDQKELCPFLQSDGEERLCAWNGALELNLEAQTGRFSQTWEVFAPTTVSLPGDENHWPQELQANGQSIAVATNPLEPNRPAVRLEPGRTTLSGTFVYQELPESFPIPTQTGILRLTVLGKAVPFPKIENGSGLVWLQQEKVSEAEKEDRLELRVHRKLTDEIPFQMTTLLTLNVSGQNREVLLKDVLLENFVAMELKGPLPARLESKGALRVQIKPGEWSIELTSRHLGSVQEVSLLSREAPWPQEEVWVFQAENNLRLVWVEGVPSMDPQQTTLPEAWKKLPAYRVKPGDTLKLVEKRRGDADPAPDQLYLKRRAWLDFDGGGYTFSDQVSGELSRSQRLDMNLPLLLGRVSLNGQDQLITQLPGEQRRGVEMRLRKIDAQAESRVDGALRKLPVVGWNHDFQSVSSELQLPPGWRLFAVTGVDKVIHSWVSAWTLMDLFLLFITALAFAKLWGWKWGVVTLLALTLLFPETGAPKWIWLAVALGFALLKLLPKGKLSRLVQIYKWGALIVLLLISLPFILQQVRVGIFPALEAPHLKGVTYPYQILEESNAPMGNLSVPQREPEAAPLEIDAESQFFAGDSVKEEYKKGLGKMKSSVPPPVAYAPVTRRVPSLQAQLPGSKVQTGPGLPQWNWNLVELQWSGPVTAEQNMHLFLWGPKLNLFLALLRVSLLIALLFCVLPLPKLSWSQIRKGSLRGALGLLVLLSSLSLQPAPAQADYPPEKLLDQLQEELLKTSACYPQCASISRMHVETTPQELRLRLEVHAQGLVALPLPGSLQEWTPSTLSVDGFSLAPSLRTAEGQLWIALPPGVHQVQMAGPLPEVELISLSLPLKPHLVTSQLQGWNLSGLSDGFLPDQTLQLTRTQAVAAAGSGAEGGALQSGKGATQGLKPYVQVTRRLVLGLNWNVVTGVTRLTPLGVPVVLEVPLLPGESVTTEGVRVSENKAVVDLAPQARSASWVSTLETTDQLNLQAPESLDYMETWDLEANSLWHVETSGIPPVHRDQAATPYGLSPQWRPWPGEKLELKISRPEGVAGPTLTMDRSLQEIRPGLRHSEVELSFQLRSSLGGQHAISLPKGAQLQEVKINEKVQPIRLEAGQITLPIVPGMQNIQLKWQQPGGMGFWFRGPVIDLRIPSVNSEIEIEVPNNRWLLWTGGPMLGPSILFWSLLLVLLFFAFVLSRTGKTPLGLLSWFLLGIGVTQFPDFPTAALLLVVGWFLLMSWRQRTAELKPFWFDLRQLLIVAYAILFVTILLASIHQGLLGRPEMQINGGGSYPGMLHWFQDRSGNALPRPWVISVPLYVYRLAMLAWALWIAVALLKWMKWAWQSFATGHLWKSLGIFKARAKL